MRTLTKVVAVLLLAVCHPLAVRADSPVTDIAIIVHPTTPVQQLKPDQLVSIFTGSMRSWPDGKNIVAFNAPAKTELRMAFDQEVLSMTPEQNGRFWIDAQIRGFGRPPRQFPDPALAVRLVATLPGAVSYVPANLVNSSVKVVARIVKGKVVVP